MTAFNAAKKKEINLDLLRILCMIMVVCNHTLSWGGLIEGTLVPGSANWFLGNAMYALCLQAVNCFVLISGYFLCTSRFKLSKLVSVWFSAFFYSVAIYVLLACIPGTGADFSIKELIKSAMVFTMDRYWFVTDYLLLYITFPFLNCAIRSMDRKMHFICCCVLFGAFSLLPNLVYISDFSGINGGYSYTWFCVLYMFAAYFRLYVPKKVKYQKWMLPAFAALSLVICGERFIAYYVTPAIFGSVALTSLFYSYNSIVALPCALALFQTFRGMEIKSLAAEKGIRTIAPLTFAVYLIHEQDWLRPVLWKLLNPGAMYDSVWVIPYIIVCVLGIFTACCLIECVRRRLFDFCRITETINFLCSRLQSKVCAWLDI